MRIAVIVTARPSWAKLQPVCEALRATPGVELQILACASALLERYGKVVDVIEAQGFSIAERVYSVYEGENLETSAKESGALATALASVLRSVRPGCVVVCADRHEVLAAALAAAYLHIPLVHLQGGEQTGSIDDKVRDAITALADYHFTATEQAKYRVYSLTGALDRIWHVGCPSIDMAVRALSEPPVTGAELGGAGPAVALDQPFLLVLQHPDTRWADQAEHEMRETLFACYQFSRTIPTVVFWPGQDAGAAGISKAIRQQPGLHTVRNLPPNRFLRLLTQCAVLIGNSSAGIREASYLGVPVVNVGLRQHGRERGPNVIDVPAGEEEAIARAIAQQLARGRYPSCETYGRGDAGRRIAEVLVEVEHCDRADSGAHRIEVDPA
jgi:UDP-hydrolysing UDP-N-acetyl-D-glucosamine 2-epimerase